MPSAHHDRRRGVIAALLPGAAFYVLLAIATGLYWPGLSGPLILDDVPNLGPLNTLDAAGALNWASVIHGGAGGLSARPASMFSFYLDWLAHSGSVWRLKLTNLAVHLLCATLVFWLTGRLLAQPVAELQPRRWWIAWWVAAAWLSAPMFVSTVLYIVQRMAQLSTLFVLAGLLCYVIGRQRIEARPWSGYALILCTFVVFLPLAVSSKENGVLLPLLAVLIEGFFFASRGMTSARARLVRWTLAVVLITLGVIVAGKVAIDPQWVTADYARREFSLSQRLLTQPRVLADYAANVLLVPGGSALGIFHDDFTISRGGWSPPSTALAIVLWTVVVAGALLTRGTRLGMVGFAALFFFAAHLVESSVLPLELYFEHRNYLPGVGLFFGAGVGLYYLLERGRFVRAAPFVLVLIPLLYSAVTFNRVLIWQSWGDILLASEHTHPGSRRVHAGLAVHYIQRGDLSAAFEHLEYANQLDAGRRVYGVALQYLVAYCANDRAVPRTGYRRIERLARITDDPYDAHALRWLTNLVAAGDCPQLDSARVGDAVHRAVVARAGRGVHGGNWALHYHTARLLAAAGDYRRALVHLESVRDLRPRMVEPLLLAAQYLAAAGDRANARTMLAELGSRSARELAPYRHRLAVLLGALH